MTTLQGVDIVLRLHFPQPGVNVHRGDRKTKSVDIDARRRGQLPRGHNAHQFAAGIEQPAARIALVDRRIRTQGVECDRTVIICRRDRDLFGQNRHNALRNGCPLAVCIADRIHRLADRRLRHGRGDGVALFELVRTCHFEHGEVGIRIVSGDERNILRADGLPAVRRQIDARPVRRRGMRAPGTEARTQIGGNNMVIGNNIRVACLFIQPINDA